MKLSMGARRDNLFCRFFSVSQRLNLVFNVCANKLSLSLHYVLVLNLSVAGRLSFVWADTDQSRVF